MGSVEYYVKGNDKIGLKDLAVELYGLQKEYEEHGVDFSMLPLVGTSQVNVTVNAYSGGDVKFKKGDQYLCVVEYDGMGPVEELRREYGIECCTCDEFYDAAAKATGVMEEITESVDRNRFEKIDRFRSFAAMYNSLPEKHNVRESIMAKLNVFKDRVANMQNKNRNVVQKEHQHTDVQR